MRQHHDRVNGADYPLHSSDLHFNLGHQLGRQSAQMGEILHRLHAIELSIQELFKRRIRVTFRDVLPAIWGIILLLGVLAGKVTIPKAIEMIMGKVG
jgi:hypothetical protein